MCEYRAASLTVVVEDDSASSTPRPSFTRIGEEVEVHISKIRPCAAGSFGYGSADVGLLRQMISPGTRRAEQREEHTGRTAMSLQRSGSAPLAFPPPADDRASAPARMQQSSSSFDSSTEDRRSENTAVAWAHARYRANVPWNQTIHFRSAEPVEILTLRCTEDATEGIRDLGTARVDLAAVGVGLTAEEVLVPLHAEGTGFFASSQAIYRCLWFMSQC